MKRADALAALLLCSGAGLAAPAHAAEVKPVFAGEEAWPIVPPTRCPKLLQAALVQQNGASVPEKIYRYGAQLQTGQPLQVGSCWKGRLNGDLFILTGYTSASAEGAVMLQYRGRTTVQPLGLGTPNVLAFTGRAVCYLPNPAKGMVQGFDIVTGRSVAVGVCPQPAESRSVLGLNKSYPFGYGVRRLDD